MMKKTIAYIDGFNLYYGLLQKVPRYKWLDPYDPPPTRLGVKSFNLKFPLVFAQMIGYNDFVLPVKGRGG